MENSKESDRRSAVENLPPKLEGLSREELHRLVWERPMYKLAEHFGLSGNGLAKICRKLNVPVPNRGWWARKAVGQKVKIPGLPPLTAKTPEAVKRGRQPERPVQKPEAQPAVKPRVEKTPPTVISKRLTNPHSLIAQFLEKPIPAAGTRVWTRTDRNMRILRIYDALFKLLEAGGAQVSQTERTYRVSMMGVEVEFYIREGSPGAVWNAGWVPGAEDGRETRLTFVSKSYLPGLRDQWLETKRKWMEEIVPEYAVAILQGIPVRAEEWRLDAERRRRREEERERLAEQERLKARDDARWQQFLAIAKRQKEAELARSFLRALQEREYDPGAVVAGRRLDDWIAWAIHRTDQADALAKGVKALFDNLEVASSA